MIDGLPSRLIQLHRRVALPREHESLARFTITSVKRSIFDAKAATEYVCTVLSLT